MRITVRAGRVQFPSGRRREELVILKERFDRSADGPTGVELALQATEVVELLSILQDFADSYRSEALDRY